MNSPTGIAELLVQYTDGADHLNEEVVRGLEKPFAAILSRRVRGSNNRPPRLEWIAAEPDGVADRLARIILNFSRTAAGCPPNAKPAAEVLTRILEFVQRGIPIEAQMLWSPKKHWMLGPESAVDLAELAALQTLLSIDSAVRPIYRAGMSFVIDLEDIEFQFMEGENEEVANAQEIYRSGMTRLLKALGLDELFTLRRMSERAKDAEELRRWRQQMVENYRALEAYWYESEGCAVSSWETLVSFKEIRRLGWKGTILPAMRRYYINRLGRLTDASDAKKVDMVLRNFAGILLHHQVGLLRGSGGACPLKFSFVRAADAAPAELLDGRIDLRFAPRRLCSRVSAAGPWATKGFVCGRGNDVRVSFRGWHELAGAEYRFTKGWFTIAGQQGVAMVRADFMRED